MSKREYPVPVNETERLKALQNYDIMDSISEDEFDRLTELASLICQVPISLVSLLDNKRQWFKSKFGFGVSETIRELSFCQYAILDRDLFEVPDAMKDNRFVDNELVTSDPNIRFYAGQPIVDPDGFVLGTLCVIDRKPGMLSADQRRALELLAQEVTTLIVERRQKMELKHFEKLFQLSTDMICIAGVDGYFRKINPAFEKVLGFDSHYILNTSFLELIHPDDVVSTEDELQKLADGVSTINFTNRFRTKSDGYKTLQWVATPEEQTGNIFAIARDISAERKKEEALRKSEEQLRSFFENSQGFMCTHDLEGNFKTVNNAGARSLGYASEEMIRMSLYDIVAPAKHDFVRAYLKEIHDQGKSKGQMIVKGKAGESHMWLYNNVLESNFKGDSYVIGNAIDVTERFRLEEDLRKTKETLEQTNKVAHVGGWELDLRKNVLTWSAITRDLHEVDADYVPDLTSAINFYKEGESRKKIEEAVRQSIKHGKSWDLELQIVTQKGNEIWVRALGDSDFKDGISTRVYGSFQNIDASKNAELEISRSRKLFRDVLAAASESSIIATDVDGLITVFNKGAEKLLGYTAEEVIGIHNPGIFHAGAEVLRRGLELTAEYGYPVEGFRVFVQKPELEGVEKRAWTYIRKNGEERTVSLTVTAIRDIDETIIGYLGIATDVTETKIIEEALATERLRLAAFARHAPAAIAMLDQDMNYIAASNKWVSDFNLQGKKITGASHYELFPFLGGDVRARHIRILNGAIERNEEERVKLPGSTEDIFVTWEMRPWYRADDSIGGIMMFTQNITSIIKQREELKVAKLLAEQASIAKSEFLANMSHEIRTPLNGVIGFTDLIIKTNLNETQEQYITIINQSANALLSIINDILDFSKIEAGKLELENEKFDLYEMCGQATDIITYNIQKKQIEMLLNISNDLPRFIYSDSVRLKQILVNLLSNAAKFTEKGEIELKIEPLSVSESETTIRFGVRDTGIGIKAEKQQKIFEAFSQEDGSTTKKYGGTGLGLTISNKLLGLMGSRLQLESTLGVGSYFYFDVTFRSEKGAPINWGNIDLIKSVLIVDDNDNNRTILNQMMMLKNIKTTDAKNGLDALQILAGGAKFDVILMDYHMPYMDGLETIRKIRENFNSTVDLLPVILLYSSSDDEKIIRACEELKVNHRLVKPVKMQDIYYVLSHLNKREETPAEPVLTDVSGFERQFTVLLAEDNNINMLLTRTIIKKNAPNAIITEAKNGLEAVKFCKKQQPDIILMDIQMPEMNGYEATKQIRLLNPDVHTPIIALTAGNVKGEREKCLEAGMDDFVVKPIVEQDVMDVFREWLSHIFPAETAVPAPGDENMSDHFDYGMLLDNLGDDKAVIAEMMALIKVELAVFAGNLEAALRDEDLVRLNEIGHKLYGSAGSVGFKVLSQLAGKFEHLEEFNYPEVAKMVAEARDEITLVLKLVDRNGQES